jgi:hypothetical protein
MKTNEKKDKLLKFTAASLLLFESFAGAGCNAASRLNQRLSKLAAPQTLARSSGGSYATTDSYLSLLEIPEPSTQVLAAVSQLPREDAIIFIAPSREPDIELVYRVIATLSWPREVGALHCSESPMLLFKPRAEKNVRWLLLFRIKPSQSSTVTAEIGPHLKLVSAGENAEWTSYCSR